MNHPKERKRKHFSWTFPIYIYSAIGSKLYWILFIIIMAWYFFRFNIMVKRILHWEYMGVEGLFNLPKLKVLFNKNKLKFLFELLNNIINCPKSLKRMNFKINTVDSHGTLFVKKKNIKKLYLIHFPCNILITLGNTRKDIDFFNLFLNEFSFQS